MAKILQRQDEIDWFKQLAASEGVLSDLEIGSKYGGSLREMASPMPIGSLLVAVDLRTDQAAKMLLEDAVDGLKQAGYGGHLILGDSTSDDVVFAAEAFGPYDLLFIDADHTLPYVEKDWENYGPMARMVAFHDVSCTIIKPPPRKNIEVKPFWDKIKVNYRFEEKICDPEHNGVGVLWRE